MARLQSDSADEVKFPLDPGDVIGHGCWDTVQRLLAPVSSIWLGCFCALASMFMAELISLAVSGHWSRIDTLFVDTAWALLYAPLALFLSAWSVLVVPLLGYVFYQMIRGEHDVTWMWLVTTSVCGVMIMASDIMDDLSFAFGVVAWAVFILLLISLGVGIFFLKGWQKNAQARHLLEVAAENEMRRQHIEQKFGTATFGQSNRHDMHAPDDDA